MVDNFVRIVALVLVALMLAYGAYSLWDTAALFRDAFTGKDLLKFKPTATQTGGNPTLEELRAINPDCRGWLTIDDTHIDYPLVQGETDADYINTDIYGNFALSGSIFLDSRSAGDFTDSYTLVYGHHMDNGGMFGDIVNFTNADYFAEHPTGTLYLYNETCRIELFACLQTTAFDHVVYNPTIVNPETMQPLLDYLNQNAVQYRAVELACTDRVVGFSTCTEGATNGRVVLYGVLRPL